MKLAIKHAVGRILSDFPVLQTRVKRWNELLFWRKTLMQAKGNFYNAHLKEFYTTFFGLDFEHYAGKRVLDVGCGPVGSLEWATNAARRVGLDPLADDYVKLNKGKHAMEYVQGPSEQMPFPDGSFDIVAMFNALDHVEDVQKTIGELSRVTAPVGDLLLIYEINHPPSITEPHMLDADLIKTFEGFDVVSCRIFGIRDDHNVYGSLIDRLPHPDPASEGILCAHLRKRV